METVFDRLDRERLLQQREERLSEQNEALERLNRVNDIIRSIDQGLVSATSRREIEEVVCRHLGDRGPYELAWIGERDETSNEVVPRAWHGNEKGYLDESTFTVDGAPTGEGPAGRALKTREPQVIDDILTDPSFDPWRQEALNRGYRSCAALPLTYRQSGYGVLTIYAGRPDALSGLERSVLTDLSETIAYAIDAIETKRSLVSDRVVELEFGLVDLDVVDLARELDAELTVRNVVARSDGGLRAYVSVDGASGATFENASPRRTVTDFDVVAEHEDSCLLEVRLTDESVHARVLDHGGVVQGITATPTGATVDVTLSTSRDAREFVETFSRHYPDAELLAKREREREGERPVEFRSRVADDLTDRQLEALQTAYFSGFFATPRHRTGTEIAESLGVSQPTFNSHLRAAHRKVFDRLFAESGVGADTDAD
ncbi:bacterio-opsin activator domain-containing protein [Halospeciosus flavus]|uniref:bacterio-opsin activator domain-containing protein n=1 Tax=Halospeciosus flavus TaxID=3032283 RepID=UPI00360F0CB3